MRLMIMTDLEGVAGVINFNDYTGFDSRYYELAKRLLTQEVNAAIEGFIAGGITEFFVVDGHGPGAINPELLHDRAELFRGHFTPIFPWGLDRDIDALAFIGQHARAGTPNSHLTHTQSCYALEFTANDFPIGEYGQLALCAKELGIPTIFASGEQALCEEAEELTPGVVTVAVKRGVSPDDGYPELTGPEYRQKKTSAIHLSPVTARRRITAGAKEAASRFVNDPDSFGYMPLEAPWTLTRQMRRTEPGAPLPERTVATDPVSFIGAQNKLFGQKV